MYKLVAVRGNLMCAYIYACDSQKVNGSHWSNSVD